MKKRTKSLDIPAEVKKAVALRDSFDGHPCCILCGSPNAAPNAHYIPRSQGGLGIEENIVTLCLRCHTMYDQTDQRPIYGQAIKQYLMQKYPDWDETKLYYKK